MNQNFTQFAFTASVKAVQEQFGSRRSYRRAEESGDRFVLTEQEKPFIASRREFFMATVGENGWPYMQFRGGPLGFLKVLDDTTLGFADFRGNRQYISSGNIKATKRAVLFLIDYPQQERLKIWAEARVHELADAKGLLERVSLPDYDAKVERVITFDIQAYDWNCHQHITPRYTLEEIAEESGGRNPEFLKLIP